LYSNYFNSKYLNTKHYDSKSWDKKLLGDGLMQEQIRIQPTEAPDEDTRMLVRQIVYHIRRLMQAGEVYTKALNKNYQISVPQLNCLMSLYENGPLSPSTIAKHILVKSSTVTGIIDRLELKGLVTRSRSTSDRRVITIELTEAGKALAQAAPPPVQDRLMDGLEKLSSHDIRQVVHGLSLLTNLLDFPELPES